jgi:membrane-anchored protein YejM (alkaline phosphatase superfamily)
VTHEVVLPFCHPEYSAHRTNFRGPYSLGRRCITGRSVHDLTFDVLRQFMAAYPAHRGRIAFASFMEAHEGSLGGSITSKFSHIEPKFNAYYVCGGRWTAFIANVDRSLRAYLEELTSAHPDTFVLILSDHGSHMGPYFRYTAAGVLENRYRVPVV